DALPICTNWVKELAMAMIGMSKSSAFIPVARHRARAPAMLRPWVEVLERYVGMVDPVYRGVKSLSGFRSYFIKSLQFMKPLLVFNGIGCLVDRFWLVWRRQGDG